MIKMGNDHIFWIQVAASWMEECEPLFADDDIIIDSKYDYLDEESLNFKIDL